MTSALLLAPGGSGSSGRTVHATTIWAGGGANLTTTSNTFVDISASLPALSLDLLVGDVVELLLQLTAAHSAGNVTGYDWLIDRPAAADTNVRGAATAAHVWEFASSGADCVTLAIRGAFIATEEGLHSFKPQWKVGAGTGSILLTGTYWTPIRHTVKNLGASL